MPIQCCSARRCFGALRTSRVRTLRVLAAALAVMCMSAVVVAAVSTTLATGKATVKGKTRTVVVDSHGLTLYTLSGESVTHLKCVSSTCFMAWPPYKISAAAKLTKTAGIGGKIGRLHRVSGKFYQVTLNGHPLYTFVGDAGKKGSAKGEGITAFGGTWHVVSP
jgi:predicted lipoprotein with Yx(FWY)xxD motif